MEANVQNDVTYLAILLALFALMFALVKACDLIVGPDEMVMDEPGTEPGPQTTGTPSSGADREGQVAA
jgi:hypothetical protein